MENKMKQQLELKEITKEEVEKITEQLQEIVRSGDGRAWQISKLLSKVRETKGYKLIINPKTNENFKTFEEYCLINFDIARNTAHVYIKAKEYLDKNHADVQPGEHLDMSKIYLLSTIDDKPAFEEKLDELDKRVIENTISKRELEEEVHNLKKDYSEIIDPDKTYSYDSNIFYIPYSIENNFEDDVICVDNTRGEKRQRVFKKYFPTVTRFCNFFHKNGKEFSLRDYAGVQDFPENFKFVGNNSEIRSQIGEAVSPKMAEHIIKKNIKGKTYIELFCGAGGFSCGAHKLGKKCVWAIDANRYSAYSYKLNFSETNVCLNDIRKIDEKEIFKKVGKVDFIIGGPPCQGFSMAGLKLSFDEDPRNKLYLDYIRFLSAFKPKQFIMENVPPILQYKEKIIRDFEKIGYSVKIEKVNGLDIGMKQKRIRVFFIGNLRGCENENK